MFLFLLHPAVADEPVRAVVTDSMALACVGKKDVADCPAQVLAVGIAPPTGNVRLETVLSTLEPEGDPCDWVRVPKAVDGAPVTKSTRRKGTALPLDSKVYVEAVSRATGLPVKRFTALFRIDLEGDGKDEVLFAAESNPLPADQGFPMGAGWSVVGVRRLDGEVVKTVELLKAETPEPTEDNPSPMYRRGTLEGVTDLDGDGKLEVVVGDAYYEGNGYTVFSVGSTVRELGGSGCGV